jgi:hypothetical protein
MGLRDFFGHNSDDKNRFLTDDEFVHEKKLSKEPRDVKDSYKPIKVDHKHDDEFHIDCKKCTTFFVFIVILAIIVVLMQKIGMKDTKNTKYNIGSSQSKDVKEEIEKRDMDKFLYGFDILEDLYNTDDKVIDKTRLNR